ncbi:hypothetical protein F3Y22_tig00110597pilonHSYRG00502 [Hibiscus syriacus]|uniref:CCHC-type domain-containing protein n=1 Tax=Hibiscus syriacus TaxID=106335 RepID=A0A6A3A5W2_HIBSY|nr:hypothetical protein F3Y22_tig00110597pilonHSYRG00502 [Hibiscus syriacus]
MDEEKEYYMNLHVVGKFVRDPYLRYVGGELIRLKEDPNTISYFEVRKIIQNALHFNGIQIIYFHEPFSGHLQDNLRVLWDDTSTIAMLNYWVKYGFIDIYFEHEVDTPFIVDDILRITAAEGASEGVGEGFVDCAAERVIDCATERVAENVIDAAGIDDIGDVAEQDGLDCDRGGVDDTAAWDDGVQDVATEGEGDIDATGGGGDEGVEEFENTNEDDEESDSESVSEEQSIDSMDVPYLSDDEGDDELKSAREKNKGKRHVDEGNDSGFVGNDTDFYDEGLDEGGNNGVTEDVGGNDTDYYDNDDHGSLIMSDDDEHEEDEHNCPVSFTNGMVTAKVIAQHFEDIIRDHPKMKLKEIQRRVQSEIHVNVNLSKCRREKNMVTSRLGGNMKEEFANLWDYADELQSKNPGSTIKMTVNRVSDNSPPHFKRFYVCFDAMKRDCKEWCRPIISVDNCFLKGPFKGILLFVVGRDGNDQMYPIAWAVVEGEITDSWSWFLNIVAADLGLDDGFGYTIISDQHKGIEIVVNDVLPRVEHRNCARHMFSNWTGRKRAKSYQFVFWQIVKSTIEREWEENKDALSKIDSVLATELFSKKEKMWTKAFQMMHSKSDIVDNNLCEASSIADARYKSIITMLEENRVKIMTRIVEKRRFLTTWKYNFRPLIKKKFDIMKKDSIQWRMIWNGDNECEVKKGNKQYIVDLNEKTYEWIHSFYHKDTYIKAYKYALRPINGPQDWKKSGIEQVLPSVDKDMPRRPKKNRRKQKDEPKKVKPGHVSRIGLIMTCKRCGGQGHNKRSCTANQDLNIYGNSSIRSPSTIDSNPTHVSRKGKEKACVTADRSMRKKRYEGIGLYTNLRTGEHTFYFGTRAPKKRKGTEDHLDTQESVAPKKKKNELSDRVGLLVVLLFVRVYVLG